MQNMSNIQSTTTFVGFSRYCLQELFLTRWRHNSTLHWGQSLFYYRSSKTTKGLKTRVYFIYYFTTLKYCCLTHQLMCEPREAQHQNKFINQYQSRRHPHQFISLLTHHSLRLKCFPPEIRMKCLAECIN